MTSQAPSAETPPGAPPNAEPDRAGGAEEPGAAPGPATGASCIDREAMLAEQMAACHHVVLDCLARAARAGDAEAARHGELRLAARFMSLFLGQSGALDRHRDHVRRARDAEEKAGRESLNRQVTLAAAQGRGLAQGFEASLRNFEEAERERMAAARRGREAGAVPADLAAPAGRAGPGSETAPQDSDPAGPAAHSAADDLEGWLEACSAPQRRAETPPDTAVQAPKLTRQQRRAAERARKKAARVAEAAMAG
jgi:hypothetical protein